MKMNTFFKPFMILSILIVSVYTFANAPHQFTSGAVISASQMNANFADVYSKISSGTVLEISADDTQTCESYSSNRNVMVFDVKVRDDGGYNTGNGVYTVPTTDYYNVSANIQQSIGKYNFSYRIDGGTWEYMNYNGTTVTIKLTAGQTLEFGYLCDNKKGDTDTTVDASQSFATIIPL